MTAGDLAVIKERAEAMIAIHGDKAVIAHDNLALVERLERAEEALREIVKPDELVAANEDAFSVHAYRHCVEVARWALSEPDEKGRRPADPQPGRPTSGSDNALVSSDDGGETQ